MNTTAKRLLGFLFSFLFWITTSVAGDWPTYKHDVNRSCSTEEKLTGPLRQAWRYDCAQAPRPAWPEPGGLVNRVDFDYAPHPVIAEGIVCFGSSADDTVRALDEKTGLEKWHFIAGGPIRVAPQIVNGKVYFASDDGFVYCLDSGMGKLIWKFRGAPEDERMIGNHRMICRWPVRSGALVADGVVYCVSGMWAAEGIYIYALQADTGKIIWCNDRTGVGGMGMVDYPDLDNPLSGHGHHQGEFGMSGASPQGPLLLGDDVLFIPNGFAGPGQVDRHTGGIGPPKPATERSKDGAAPKKQASGGAAGSGGTWLTIDGNRLYTFAKHGQTHNILTVEPGGYGRGRSANEVPQLSISHQPKPEEIHEKGAVRFIVRKGKLYARKAYGIALAGDTLLCGQDGGVTAENSETKQPLWRVPVDGEAREIAVANGRLFVATRKGAIYCFETGEDKKDEGGRMKDERKSQEARVTSQETGNRNPETSVRSQESGDKSHETRDGKDETEVRKLETGNRERELGNGRMKDETRSQKLEAGRWKSESEILNPESEIINRLRSAGMDRGYALVLGDADGQLSMALAAQTQIHVVNVLTDESAANALRERLLTTTTWYGSRIHVDVVPQLDRLPHARYFANTVIVASPMAGLSGKELYRVLKPCGGILLAPGVKGAALESLVKETGASEKEIRRSEDNLFVVRGKLAGAVDWDTNPKELPADQLVKWPLRVLWFGGPGTAQVQNFLQGAPGPTVGNGRYFVKGESSLTAVDAYNGALLWSRPIPKQHPDIRAVDGARFPISETAKIGKGEMLRSLRVNDDFVYLTLGKTYFRGKGDVGIQLDARTGEQKKIYGPFNPPTPVSLKTPQSWPIEVDARHSGVVALESTAQGLVLTLTTKDPTVTRQDAWELFFDFRPVEARYGLYEHGTFQVRITVAQDKNTPAAWSKGNGVKHPHLEVSGTRETDGTRTVVTLTWAELQKLTGAKPSSFGFGVTLNSCDGGGKIEPIVRRHLFCDWTADGVNNGWASVSLDESAASEKPPAIIVGTLNQMKDRAGAATSGGDLAESVSRTPRIHPLTGEPTQKLWRVSTKCGAPFYSANTVSGRAGIYDFSEDSGLHSVGGVKTRCTTPQIVALGMIIVSEETGHCACNYPLRTSLTMAPSDRRLNEDWALFHDRAADTRVRQAALNLGAPGDRRDDKGTLWLGLPRPPAKGLMYPLAAGRRQGVGTPHGVWATLIPAALQVPIDVECFGGAEAYRPEDDSVNPLGWSTSWIPNRHRKEFGPFRVNADRIKITGTDRPWIYGSAYRGIQKATLQLDLLKPLTSTVCEKPPTLDGKLDDPLWMSKPQTILPFTKTEIFVRHDAQQLYVAARRPATTTRLGNIAAWSKNTKGEDATVWTDDSLEIFLGGTGTGPVIHLGVAASGARYDALAKDATGEDRSWKAPWTSAVTADPTGLIVETAIPWKTIEEAGLKKETLGINIEANQSAISEAPTNDPAPATAVPNQGAAGEETAQGPSPMDVEPAPDETVPVPAKTPAPAGSKPAPKPALKTPLKTAAKTPLKPAPKLPPIPANGEALCNLGKQGRAYCENFAPLGLGTQPNVPPRTFTVRLHFAELDDAKPGERVFDVKLQDQVVLKDFDIVKEAGGSRIALIKEFQHIPAVNSLTLEFVPSSKTLTTTSAPILNGLELYDEDFKVAAKLQQPP